MISNRNIFFAILAVVGVTTCFLFFCQQKGNSSNKISIKPALTTEIKESSDQNNNATAWNIYKNNQHKFLMKYPKGWHITENTDGEGDCIITNFKYPSDVRVTHIFFTLVRNKYIIKLRIKEVYENLYHCPDGFTNFGEKARIWGH